MIDENFSEKEILSTCGEKIEIVESKANLLTAKENGKFWHSFYSPQREATSLVANSECKEKSTIIFCSFGLGYGVLEACKNYPDKTIILIEPDVNYALFSFFFTDFSTLFSHEKLITLFGAETQQVIQILEQEGFENCHFIRNQNQIEHAKNYFDAIETLIKRNKQKQQINENTYKRFGKLWIKNTCKNFLQTSKNSGINFLQNSAKGKSACVIAAGPTLVNILPYLKEIQKRCILICVDTALKSVLNYGITPEFTIMVDPQYWNARHLDFLDTSKTTLITESAVYPSVFAYKWKETYFTSSIYPLGKILEKNIFRQSLGAGGSVATTAWDFARFLGCTKVFMAGLDLGYPKNETHIKGSTFEHWAAIKSNYIDNAETKSVTSLFSANPIYKTDYEGNKLQTDSRMNLYAWWFESKCAEFTETKTFSLSKKSLAIPGINYFSVEELINFPEQEKFDIEKNKNSVCKTENQTLEKEKITFTENLKNLILEIETSIKKSTENQTMEISGEIEDLIFPFLDKKTFDEKLNSLKELIKILAKIRI